MQCENTPGSFRCIEGCEQGYIWSMKYGQCRGRNRENQFFVIIYLIIRY